MIHLTILDTSHEPTHYTGRKKSHLFGSVEETHPLSLLRPVQSHCWCFIYIERLNFLWCSNLFQAELNIVLFISWVQVYKKIQNSIHNDRTNLWQQTDCRWTVWIKTYKDCYSCSLSQSRSGSKILLDCHDTGWWMDWAPPEFSLTQSSGLSDCDSAYAWMMLLALKAK